MLANFRAFQSVSRLEIGLALMAIVSIAIILLPEEWLQTSLELDPSAYPANLVDDRGQQGNSAPRWIEESAQRWECTINPGAHDPYCSIQIHVSDELGQGLDLSKYNKMSVWADYKGNANYVRLYFRNRHPNYYVPGIDISTKYNMVQLPVASLSKGLRLNMRDFVVASWWIIGGNVPLEDSHPEFNDVSIIEVQTGSQVRSGTHEIQLKKIQWTGALIQQSTLYQIVIATWSMAVFAILLYRLVVAHREISRQVSIQKELTEINTALSLETRRFEELAKTDSLTGLLNRVGIRDILYRSMVEWRTKGTPFSFIIIDLDKFKEINDTYGHTAGDKVLQDAAKLMLGEIRHTDALTRWGGEEFVLACPGSDLNQAVQIAEKLRATLAENLKCHDKTVTASFGVSTMKVVNVDKLFNEADEALYQAKKLGRNRVCVEVSA